MTAGERNTQSPATLSSFGVRCGTNTRAPSPRGCSTFHSAVTSLTIRGPRMDRTAAPPRFARNLAAVLIWELLWGFGAACVSSSIFVPFLSKLEGSKRLVGTVGLTTLLGIPALFVSLWLAHRLHTKRFAVGILYTV